MAKKENIYKRFPILDIEWVRSELMDAISGFELQDISIRSKKSFNCYYMNSEKEKIKVAIKANGIIIKKSGRSIAETIIIPDVFNLIKNTLEKRSKGIIVENIHKRYANSKRFEGQKVLVDLWSKRYAISYISLGAFLKLANIEKAKPQELFEQLALFTQHDHLQAISNLVTDFSTHMDYVNCNVNSKNIALNRFSDKTYVNNIELPYYHYLTDDKDKLDRIYDLYRGIISKKTISDIDDIHYGLISPEAFKAKDNLGITTKENNFVGEETINEEQLSYATGYLKTKYGYPGPISFDRDTLLAAIMYRNILDDDKIIEVIKQFNISYSEYMMLSEYEKEKLIKGLTSLKK